MKFGTLFFAVGINAESENTQTLANVNWEALATQRTDSSATCAGRVNWRTKFLDDSIYHMCMMDTDLYLEEYNPEGTSIFSNPKIYAIVDIYGGDSNDIVFGYPTQDCGCFPGCQDFKVGDASVGQVVTHLTDFCCSDWVDECVSPPNARDALAKAISDADEFMKTINTTIPKRKLTRFERKLLRNIDADGDVICSGKVNEHDHEDGHERLHHDEQTIINPNAAHVISDRLWHIVDHYFRDCDLVRHHFNRANRFGNALQKALRR